MPNSYFKFKQFTIHQDKCAMKVCTDACLFGALVAGCKTCLPNARVTAVTPDKQFVKCLEIGTGTGLLALMLAQKNNILTIDAVEIDAAAATQATENITASPWADRIHVFNEDILNYESKEKYDCIVSNPPFFEDDLQSADEAKNNAKHDTALNLLQLLQVVNGKLIKDGFFAVLLPYHRVGYFTDEAKKNGLYLSKQILVKQTFKHKFFRGILFFSRKETEPQFSEIIIRDTEHNYTPEFAAALKDYYLFL
jgi:tRNA1Val (adenine37-N6)-methyltransferase